MTNNTRGFSLLEIILVLGVLSTIALYASVALVGFLRTAQLETAADSVVELATQARGSAIEGEQFAKWGIFVGNPAGQRPYLFLFACLTDACAGPNERKEIQRYIFPPLVSMIIPAESDIIVFNQRSGTVASEDTHYIVIQAGEETRIIEISGEGNIQTFPPQGETGPFSSPPPGGVWSDVAIGQDGLPVFSHSLGFVATVDRLFVTKCLNADCSQHNTATIFEGSNDKPIETEIGILAEGKPFVAFRNYSVSSSSVSLKVISCVDPNCLLPVQIRIPDPPGADEHNGYAPSLAIDPQGRAVIAHVAISDNQKSLRFVRCLNTPCTQAVSRELAQLAVVSTSIIIGSSGFPVIAFSVSGVPIQVIACDDPNCDPNVGGPDPVYTPDPAASGTGNIGMALNSSGNPVIVYESFSFGEARVVTCATPDCSITESAVTALTDMYSIDRHKNISITIGPDNLPGITYAGVLSGVSEAKWLHNTALAGGGGGFSLGVMFAKCSVPDCASSGSVPVSEAQENYSTSGVSSALYGGNNVVIGYTQQLPDVGFVLGIHMCQNPFCN